MENLIDKETIKETILEAYRFRHACRQFDPDAKIPDSDFGFILETARLSPSSFGFEPWKLVVLKGAAVREKLLPVSWGARTQFTTASHAVLILARTQDALLPKSEHIQSMMRNVQQLPEEVVGQREAMYGKFLESDFDLLGNERAMFEWAARQSYIALGNMMTSAALIGIDSCPIEGFDKAQAENVLREEGLLADGYGLACMAAFGYRVNEPRSKTRRDLADIVEWVD